MESAIKAVKQLLETAIEQPDSPLADIKRVYFGDPIKIPEKMLPAITVQPVVDEVVLRGSRYDQKNGTIEVRIVFNQSDYYNSEEKGTLTISNAVYSSGEITFTTTTDHELTAGDSIRIYGVDPEDFNGTFFVSSVVDTTNFKVSKTISTPPTYSSGGTLVKSTDDTVQIVQKAIRMAEKDDLTDSQKTADNSVAGVIQRNLCLPLTTDGVTERTAQLARVESVQYLLDPGVRPFPTMRSL